VRLQETASNCAGARLAGLEISRPEGCEHSATLKLDPNLQCSASRSHVQIEAQAATTCRILLGITEDSVTPCTCACNLAHSFVNRHRVSDILRPLTLPAKAKKGYLNQLTKLFSAVVAVNRKAGHEKWKTYRDVAESYSGTKRIQALKIIDDIEANGFTQRMFFDAMVKWGERTDRPRAIVPQQFYTKGSATTKAGQRMNGPIIVELPARLKLEETFHQIRNKNGTRKFASGRSLRQQAHDVIKMFPPGWLCLSMDAESYDGSQGWLAVLERMMFLKKVCEKLGYPKLDELRRALHAQDTLNVESRGLKANITGNRASGTGGTSAANKAVFVSALEWAMGKSIKSGRAFIYCNGDDTLLFIHPKEKKWVRSWCKRIKRLGIILTLDNVATTPSEVVFCRAKIVFLESGPVFVKMPADAFKTQTSIVRHFKGTEFEDYVATLADGLGRLWHDVPVHRCIGKMFGEVKGKIKTSLLAGSGIEYQVGRTGKTPQTTSVSMADRLAYENTFGINVATQLQLEEAMLEIGRGMPEAIKRFVPGVRRGPQPKGAFVDHSLDVDRDVKDTRAKLEELQHVQFVSPTR